MGNDTIPNNRFSMFQFPNQNQNYSLDWINQAPIDSKLDNSVLGGYYGNSKTTPDSFLGDKKINPWVTGMQAFSGLANAYLGKKALDLSSDQFDFSKSSFNTNLANKSSLINTELEDRQRSRLTSSGKYNQNTAEGKANLQRDLESYLSTRRVSGSPI